MVRKDGERRKGRGTYVVAASGTGAFYETIREESAQVSAL